MKYCLATLFIILLSGKITAEQNSSSDRKIATFCKVWGFLKYYHPNVVNGKLDWDRIFLTEIDKVRHFDSKQDENEYYLNWLSRLGKLKSTPRKPLEDTIILSNLSIEFISDTNIFNNNVIEKLNAISECKVRKQYYVKQSLFVKNTIYNREKLYKDSIFPDYKTRLLLLARYWNIINYFYPYKYKTDQEWDSVLLEMIPKLMEVKDVTTYHLAITELVAKINDSHAYFYSSYTQAYFGNLYVPFSFKLIDSMAVVSEFYNKSLCLMDDIKEGDAFFEIEGRAVADLIRQRGKYVSASNESKLLDNYFNLIFNGNWNYFSAKFIRNDTVYTKNIYRYNLQTLFDKTEEDNKPAYYWLQDSIAYFNLGKLKRKEAYKAVNSCLSARAIIFDVRNYPLNTAYPIAKAFKRIYQPFVKFSYPDLTRPGTFKLTKAHGYKQGNKNETDTVFKGKIAVLFNENTQSHAEFTVMSLELIPDVTKIGSQTSGADGNVSKIPLPGGLETLMTGIGVYYPDGRETQRIGIVPDIYVKPTIKGITSGKDEVLEAALKFLNK